MAYRFRVLADLLAAGAADAPAIGAPERDWLSYGDLRGMVEEFGVSLRALGVGPSDSVAIVLPNGPEMAATFVGVAAHAVAAPLNPAYREDEFTFYMTDLGVKLLLVLHGDETPAIQAAARHDIPVVALVAPPDAPAGYVRLPGGWKKPAAEPAPDASAPALVLHTSGTTSRPKIVPLSQGNLCASAEHIAATLSLTAEDRCLNIMPLFHIHGLIAAVLSTLAAGASIVCTPGFNALKAFGWLKDADPTWYTAVPTMHQALLARADRNAEIVKALRLRFIRSSSSSLPPQVMAELEQVFGCPVIEAYGMTEATHQMASNPLPPRDRKPGSVGIAAGPEVAIMDLDGRFLPAGGEGEIVIRGPNVTAGYVNNEKANAEAFSPDPRGQGGAWFRTGDQGTMDDQGYVRITGRLKEIINRGGEKVSPREVDEVLMDHPAVAQVVTFAVPHDKLGEEVAAAVVLREGAEATERQIRDFAATRLADFKVPRKVLILDEIPKGATGKLQRIGLAQKLGLV